MTEPDPWRCSVCGRMYAVPSLARDCERREGNAYQTPAISPRMNTAKKITSATVTSMSTPVGSDCPGILLSSAILGG